MAASGSVDVVIGAVPSEVGQVRPAFELEVDLHALDAFGHDDLLRLHEILRPPGIGDVVRAGWEENVLAVGAVDLRVEEEIRVRVARGDAAGRQRIDAAELRGRLPPPVRSLRHRQAIILRFGEGGLRLGDSIDAVGDDERGHRRRPVDVAHPKHDFGRGPDVEEDVDRVAEADVLRPLADVEAELGFPPSGVLAVELQDDVFEFEPGETVVT